MFNQLQYRFELATGLSQKRCMSWTFHHF